MIVFLLVIGAGVGAGLGWLLGRFNSRRKEDCKTPT